MGSVKLNGIVFADKAIKYNGEVFNKEIKLNGITFAQFLFTFPLPDTLTQQQAPQLINDLISQLKSEFGTSGTLSEHGIGLSLISGTNSYTITGWTATDELSALHINGQLLEIGFINTDGGQLHWTNAPGETGTIINGFPFTIVKTEDAVKLNYTEQQLKDAVSYSGRNDGTGTINVVQLSNGIITTTLLGTMNNGQSVRILFKPNQGYTNDVIYTTESISGLQEPTVKTIVPSGNLDVAIPGGGTMARVAILGNTNNGNGTGAINGWNTDWAGTRTNSITANWTRPLLSEAVKNNTKFGYAKFRIWHSIHRNYNDIEHPIRDGHTTVEVGWNKATSNWKYRITRVEDDIDLYGHTLNTWYDLPHGTEQIITRYEPSNENVIFHLYNQDNKDLRLAMTCTRVDGTNQRTIAVHELAEAYTYP